MSSVLQNLCKLDKQDYSWINEDSAAPVDVCNSKSRQILFLEPGYHLSAAIADLLQICWAP